MSTRLAALLAVALALAAPANGESLPRKDLARETYDVLTDPAGLPDEVRTAWAAELRQKQLNVAPAGGRYNSTDFGGGTRHRLILAAASPKYAIVYFESGGIAVYRRVFVFARAAPDAATFIWGGRPKESYQDPKRFLAAIRNGKLWQEGRRER